MILEIGGRSAFIDSDSLHKILGRLRPANRQACALALKTGLRIDDVLRLRTAALDERAANNYWLSVTESKTGKLRKVKVDKKTLSQLKAAAGAVYVFEHRCNPERHRARQTVYKDFKRCARDVIGVDTAASVHSLRKVYAVEKFKETGNLQQVQRDLNHSNISTTALYALSDKM